MRMSWMTPILISTTFWMRKKIFSSPRKKLTKLPMRLARNNTAKQAPVKRVLSFYFIV
jgi:hypothetical protein